MERTDAKVGDTVIWIPATRVAFFQIGEQVNVQIVGIHSDQARIRYQTPTGFSFCFVPWYSLHKKLMCA